MNLGYLLPGKLLAFVAKDLKVQHEESGEVTIFIHYAGHLIGCDKKSEIVRYFQGRLCNKIGLLCDKLCDFFLR